ncbi:MAG: VWA domain-containing protein [Candidatus Helarchaeota archaeon]|nr:VWA domain-containing protein [Candidatus Helarchaeota archaeon]
MVFTEFFYNLRKRNVPVSLTEWLVFIDALQRNFVDCNSDKFYFLARALLVKKVNYFDNFDEAFLETFSGMKIPLDLKEAIEEWLQGPFDLIHMLSPEERLRLLQSPLFEKFRKTLLEAFKGFKIPLEASEALNKWLENPFELMSLLTPKQLAAMERLTLEELRRLFEERMSEQDERHDGGDHWIGTGGTSPFGQGGAHPTGISLAERTRSHSAIQVAMRREFRNYRSDLTLDIRQIQMALKKLRNLRRTGLEEELDLEETIDKTCKNAGELEIVMVPPRKNRAKVLLLMDAGGSMDPYYRLVNQIFSAAHQLKTFKAFKYLYFHNCIYDRLFKNMAFRESIETNELLRTYDKDYKLIIVGDASMAHSELFARGGSIDYYNYNPTPGIIWLKQLKNHFEKSVWINPVQSRYWYVNSTIYYISKVFPMFYLSLDGLDEAVKKLL